MQNGENSLSIFARSSLAVVGMINKGVDRIPAGARSCISSIIDGCVVSASLAIPFLYALSSGEGSFLTAA